MPVSNHDRPVDVVREEVIDRLIMNYAHKELSLDAFERRLDQAMESNDPDELAELTADLELKVDKQYANRKKQELDIDYSYGETLDVEQLINIFGGSKRAGGWNVPKEIRMVNLFGGGELDFSEARFACPTVHIKMLTLFGGAKIYVRENINTVVRTISIFGGTENRAPSNAGNDAPTVIVEGLVLFGGVTIKIKRSIREAFLDFADRIRGIHHPSHERR